MVKDGHRWRRWALALGAVLLALAAAVTWGPSLLNLERYRGQIARQVGRAIGREVTVGAIRASFWRLGAEAEGIRVAERPGYGSAPFLEAEALRVRVELLPLLRGQVRVATALLERPRIHLVRDREGRWNIQDLWAGIVPAPAPPSPGRPAGEAPRGARVGAVPAFLVGILRARGGELRVDDLGAPPERAPALAVKDLRLDVRQDGSPDAVTFQAAADVSGGQLQAAASLTARGDGLAVEAKATLKGFDLETLGAFVGPGVASGPANLAVTAKGPLAGLDLSGDLDLTRARVVWKPLAPKPPGEEAHLTFSGRTQGEVGAGLAVNLPKVRLRWRGMAVQGRLAAARLRPLEVTFDAQATPVDLGRLLVLPQGKGRPEAKASALRALFFPPAAWAAVPPAASSPPASAPPRADPRGPAGPPSDPTGGASPIRAEGTLGAEAVRWQKVEAKEVRTRVAFRDGILDLRDIQGKLYGGRLAGAGTVDLRGRHPALSLAARVEEVQAEPLVAAAVPGKVEVHGVLTADGKVSSPGLTPGGALGTLVGSGSFLLTDGRVNGYKPLERLADVLAAAAAGRELKARLDEFQRLSGTFILDKGFLRTRDLTLVRPDGDALAVGSVNLLDTSLNFDVTARLGRASLEAKVQGTAAEPLVIPKVARLEKRFEMEIDRALKGERGKRVQELLRNLLR